MIHPLSRGKSSNSIKEFFIFWFSISYGHISLSSVYSYPINLKDVSLLNMLATERLTYGTDVTDNTDKI